MIDQNHHSLGIQIRSTDILIFCAVFFTGFISFSYLGYGHILAGDDWQAVVRENISDSFTLRMGRWMHKFISDLTYNRTFSPLFSVSFLLFMNAMVAVLVANLLKIKSVFEKGLFVILLVNNPIWFEAYLFRMGHFPKAFGVLFSVLSAYIFIRFVLNRKKYVPWIIASIICLTLSAACYQTYSFFGFIIILFYLLQEILEGSNLSFSSIKKFLFLSIGSVGLYGLLTFIFIQLFDLSAITEGRYGITDTSGLSNYMTNFSVVIKKIFNFYFKGEQLIPAWISIASIFGLIAVLFSIFKLKTTARQKVLACLIVAFTFIIPWSLAFLKQGLILRYNMMVPLTLLMAFYYFRLYNNVKNTKGLHIGTAIGFSAILFYMMFFNNAASYAKYLSVAKDNNLTGILINHIVENDEYNPEIKYRLLFVGKNPYRKIEEKRPFDITHNEYPDNLMNQINCGIWDCQLKRITDQIYLEFAISNIRYSKRGDVNYKKVMSQINMEKVQNWPNNKSIQILNDMRVICVFFEK